MDELADKIWLNDALNYLCEDGWEPRPSKDQLKAVRKAIGAVLAHLVSSLFPPLFVCRLPQPIPLPITRSQVFACWGHFPRSHRDAASPPKVTRHSSVPCRPQSPCFWWVNENAFASSRLDLAHPRPTSSSSGWRPWIMARYFSASPSDSASWWTPCPPGTTSWLQVRLGCVRLSSLCPFRLLHTFLSPGRGVIPAFGYGAPHPSAGRT
jgi:hypothetical protein